jgi:histidinol-phosphate phosphatase family protein
VVTNQLGIGRGYFDERAFADLTRWMCDRFTAESAQIARVYHCPYHPVHGVGAYRCDHPWRKPNPGMLLQAASDLGLDLKQSAIVGNHISDIEAGAAAGVGVRILLGSRPSRHPRRRAVRRRGCRPRRGARAVACPLCAELAPGLFVRELSEELLDRIEVRRIGRQIASSMPAARAIRLAGLSRDLVTT